jgi:hypothetical protein
MARREDSQMTGGKHRLLDKLRSWVYLAGAATGRQLRALMPPTTAKVFFRALLGVLLFFCGIVFGVWLIIRLRRHIQDGGPGGPSLEA